VQSNQSKHKWLSRAKQSSFYQRFVRNNL